MDEQIGFSVLIAAKDEELSISQVTESHIALLSSINFPFDWEIGVLDDGSNDNTLREILNVQKRFPEIRIWHNDKPSGIANAFKQLAENAQYEWIYITSGDGQFPAEALEKMLDVWLRNQKTTLGVREGRFKTYGRFRSLISWLFLVVTRMLFGINLHDPGSVKIIKKKYALAELISESTMRDAEQLAKAAKSDNGIQFVSIPFLPRETGQASGVSRKNLAMNIRDSIFILWSILKN